MYFLLVYSIYFHSSCLKPISDEEIINTIINNRNNYHNNEEKEEEKNEPKTTLSQGQAKSNINSN